MKQCPKCKAAFEESLSAEVPLDDISTQLLERQKSSGLCSNCALAEMMQEIGKTMLAHPQHQGIK